MCNGTKQLDNIPHGEATLLNVTTDYVLIAAAVEAVEKREGGNKFVWSIPP